MQNPERSWSVLSTDHKPSGMLSSVDNAFRESHWVDNAFSDFGCGRRMGAWMLESSRRPLRTGFRFVADDGSVDAAPKAIFVRVPFPTHAFSTFCSPPRAIFVRYPGHNLSTDRDSLRESRSVDNAFRESRWVDNAFSVGSCGRRMGAGMREFSCRPPCTGFCFVADDGRVDAAPDAIFVRVPFPTHAFSAFSSPPRVIFVRSPRRNHLFPLTARRSLCENRLCPSGNRGAMLRKTFLPLREYHVPEGQKNHTQL